MEPNVIVGTGGYASALPIKVGIGWKIPTVIQEQNSYPGLITRLFAEPATAVYAGTSDTGTYLDTEIEVTGNPVRSEIRNGSKTAGSELFQFDGKRKTVFLFGGSQGSAPLNRAIQSVLPVLQDQGIQLLWQTGLNNNEALKIFEEIKPDLILLDIMLPEISGIDVCREIRTKSDVPIIMVTAKGEEIDTVLGLEIGADDYVTKPYRLRELVARIRSVLRRAEDTKKTKPTLGNQTDNDSLLEVGTVSVNLSRHEVLVDDQQVMMPLKEFDLLVLLMENPNRVLTRDTIVDRIWGFDYVGDTKTLDVLVSPT